MVPFCFTSAVDSHDGAEDLRSDSVLYDAIMASNSCMVYGPVFYRKAVSLRYGASTAQRFLSPIERVPDDRATGMGEGELP